MCTRVYAIVFQPVIVRTLVHVTLCVCMSVFKCALAHKQRETHARTQTCTHARYTHNTYTQAHTHKHTRTWVGGGSVAVGVHLGLEHGVDGKVLLHVCSQHHVYDQLADALTHFVRHLHKTRVQQIRG